MGFSIAWLAVRKGESEPLETLYGELEVRPTDEQDRYYESPLCGGSLGPWLLAIGRGCDHRIIDESLLARLSAGRELVACSIEEHAMWSSAAHWRDGRRIWSITHDAQRSIFDLTAEGELPDVFEQIRSDALEQQTAEGGEDAPVDVVFDVPLEVAKSLVGFKHDQDSEWTERDVLYALDDLAPPAPPPPAPEPVSAPRKPWWRFW